MIYRNPSNDAVVTNAIISSTSSGMPKYGHIWSTICSVIYGIASVFIIKSALTDNNDTESHNVMKWSIASVLIFVILLNTIIYFAKDKSTEEKKANARETVGWIAVGPWVLVIICCIILGLSQYRTII